MKPIHRRLFLLPLANSVLMAGVLDGNQSALNPHGPTAQSIAGLSWYMFALFGVAYAVTMAMLVVTIIRARAGQRGTPNATRALVLTWGVGVPILAFGSLLGYSIAVGRTMAVQPYKDALAIHVTGKQFWWQVQYLKGSDSYAGTANEIHVPVNTPVRLKLNSTDVIHSFWAPNLAPKMDLIPGRTNEMWLRADREGVWRGQCAEFCGAQHAHMSFEIVVEPAEKFHEWLEWQRKPAVEPVTAAARRGQSVFLEGPCIMCHAIRGTVAGASEGPDLTHLAGRRMIAAATIPNTRGHLGGWVLNAQSIKPGSKMPRMNLEVAQLETLLAYLETLR
jgi:cytochrome c oxidase subunit 2